MKCPECEESITQREQLVDAFRSLRRQYNKLRKQMKKTCPSDCARVTKEQLKGWAFAISFAMNSLKEPKQAFLNIIDEMEKVGD